MVPNADLKQVFSSFVRVPYRRHLVSRVHACLSFCTYSFTTDFVYSSSAPIFCFVVVVAVFFIFDRLYETIEFISYILKSSCFGIFELVVLRKLLNVFFYRQCFPYLFIAKLMPATPGDSSNIVLHVLFCPV